MKCSPGGGLHAGIKQLPNPSHLMGVIAPRKKGRPFLRVLAQKHYLFALGSSSFGFPGV